MMFSYKFFILLFILIIIFLAGAESAENRTLVVKPTTSTVTSENAPHEIMSKTEFTVTATTTFPAIASISTPVLPTASASDTDDGSRIYVIIVVCFAVLVIILVVTSLMCRIFRGRRCSKTRETFDYGCSRPSSSLPQVTRSPPTENDQSCDQASYREQNVFYACCDQGYENVVAFGGHSGKEVDVDVYSKCGTTRKLISASEGGIIETDYAKLQVWPGSLEKDTVITMIKNEKYPPFQEFIGSVLETEPLVIEFLPDGLKFKDSGADMTVCLPQDDPLSELFVLHGSYNSEKERVTWHVVNDELEVKRDNGAVYMRIDSFCLYTYILAKRGTLARILAHLNHSFNCHAVVLYKRIPTFPGLHLAVAFLSEFAKREDCQLSDMTAATEENPHKYTIANTGTEKRIDTHRRLEICLDFAEPDTQHKVSIRMDEDHLDKRGMVIDAELPTVFKRFPASGTVAIYEIHRNERKLIWKLYVTESAEPVLATETIQEVSSYDPTNNAQVERRGGLSDSTINRLSHVVGMHWDSLAGLMDIPYNIREQIKLDHANYPDIQSKAKKIFSIFSQSEKFSRKSLVKFSEEIDRNDLTNAILDYEETDEESGEEIDVSESDTEPTVSLRDTPLSSREMSRISRMFVDWESLAGLMDLPHSITEDIRINPNYPDTKSKVEKVLDSFNMSNRFCRDTLVGYFRELKKDDLIEKITNGLLRFIARTY